jgi:UMF1 family MFS transporter
VSLKSSFFIIGVFFALSLLVNFLVKEERGVQTALSYQETGAVE